MNWPKEVQEIKYLCKADDSLQPALVYTPDNNMAPDEKRPLLIGLHTWSLGYTQGGGECVYAKWCIQHGWLFIHPDFRGANNHPEAMGSEYVVSDISDAVNYMKEHYNVDTDRIYLIGVSGGGHAAMLMAGLTPEIWAGVSAWCGISDIRKWWQQTKDAGHGYYQNIESCVTAPPEDDINFTKECLKRSPITYLQQAKQVNLDINAGINDGRNGSVPFSQSMYAFNEVADKCDRIKDDIIEEFYNSQNPPPHDLHNISKDLYGKHIPLFIKTSSNARIVIFNGGHEIVQLAGLNWLKQQRKGQNATWIINNPLALDISEEDTQSGK